MPKFWYFQVSNKQSLDECIEILPFLHLLLVPECQIMINVTSKSVFPLQIMRKFNNLSFYHDLDLCKMSNSSLLAIS